MSIIRFIQFAGAALGAQLVFTLLAGDVAAQPRFGNPSPTAGTGTSQRANAAADTASYQEVEYANKATKGPRGRHSRGSEKQQREFHAEISPHQHRRLRRARALEREFHGAERANSGQPLTEISLAYNLGDATSTQNHAGRQTQDDQVDCQFDILRPNRLRKTGRASTADRSAVSSGCSAALARTSRAA